MFKVEKKSADRVDIEVCGTLSSNAMRAGLEELVEACEGVDHGVMLYRLSGFTIPSFGALAIELQKLPELLPLVGRFSRCALISDQAWIRAAAEIEGALIPGLTIKSFRPDEEAAAEAWLKHDEFAAAE